MELITYYTQGLNQNLNQLQDMSRIMFIPSQ